MRTVRQITYMAAIVFAISACAPGARTTPSDRAPTEPPIVLNAGRDAVFTEAFRLLTLAPGIEGFEEDTERGLFGNVITRRACGNSGGWVVDQSNQGAGFLSAITGQNCQAYNVAFGNNDGPPTTTEHRMTIAIAGQQADRSEVIISYSSFRAQPAAAWIRDQLIETFGASE